MRKDQQDSCRFTKIAPSETDFGLALLSLKHVCFSKTV